MPRQRKRQVRTGALPPHQQPQPATQAIKVPTGQPQGQRKKMENLQRAQPLPDVAQQQHARIVEAAKTFNPMDKGLTAPTEHPDEPITAGLPVGNGPGPEALSIIPAGDDVGTVVRAMYRTFPNEDLRQLIQELESEGR